MVEKFGGKAHLPKVKVRTEGISDALIFYQRPLQIVGEEVVVVDMIKGLIQKIQIVTALPLREIRKPIPDVIGNLQIRQVWLPMNICLVYFLPHIPGFLTC